MTMTSVRALTIVSLRQLLAGKRLVVLATIGAASVLVFWLSALASPAAPSADLEEGVPTLLLSLLLPLVSLTVATAAIGDELRDGTVPNVVLKPLGRGTIVVAKLAAAVAATLAIVVPSAFAAHVLVAGGPAAGRLLVAGLAATLAGAVVYGAVGLLLSLVTERALLLGLAYWLFWEGAAVAIAPGLSGTSVAGYAKGLFGAFISDGPAGATGTVQAAASAVLVTAGALAAATVRFRRMDLR